jgi:hypothetical protein
VSQEREHDALRDEFQRLRSETEGAGRVPDFGAMMERAKAEAARPPMSVIAGGRAAEGPVVRPRRALVIGGWATAALAATIAGVLLVDSGGGSAEDTFERMVAAYSNDAARGAWTSPTSALLDVPWMSLTRTMPTVGDPLRDFDPNELSRRPDPEGRDS